MSYIAHWSATVMTPLGNIVSWMIIGLIILNISTLNFSEGVPASVLVLWHGRLTLGIQTALALVLSSKFLASLKN